MFHTPQELSTTSQTDQQTDIKAGEVVSFWRALAIRCSTPGAYRLPCGVRTSDESLASGRQPCPDGSKTGELRECDTGEPRANGEQKQRLQ